MIKTSFASPSPTVGDDGFQIVQRKNAKKKKPQEVIEVLNSPSSKQPAPIAKATPVKANPVVRAAPVLNFAATLKTAPVAKVTPVVKADPIVKATPVVKKESVRTVAVDELYTTPAEIEKLEGPQGAFRPDPKAIHAGYSQSISAEFRGLQYMRMRDIATQILFSQITVSDINTVKNIDYPIDALADVLFLEFPHSLALDVVEMGNGVFTSLDNRRLLIAKKLSVIDRTYGIWIRAHKASDSLPPSQQFRFGGVKTWGEAVRDRINSSIAKKQHTPKAKPTADSSLEGFIGYPTIMTTTPDFQQKICKQQMIPVSVNCNLSALHKDDRDLILAQARKNSGIIKI